MCVCVYACACKQTYRCTHKCMSFVFYYNFACWIVLKKKNKQKQEYKNHKKKQIDCLAQLKKPLNTFLISCCLKFCGSKNRYEREKENHYSAKKLTENANKMKNLIVKTSELRGKNKISVE